MLASLAMSAGAQSKISPSGLMMLHEFNQLQSTMSTDAPVPEVGVIVRLTDGYTTEALAAAGYQIDTDLGDMAVVTMPITEVEAMAGMPEVASMSFGGKRYIRLDKAREATDVDEAHAGMAIGTTPNTVYNGAGVVAGIMDTGLEPNHVNFQGRVKRVFNFTGSTGVCKIYSTPSRIAGFTTDDATGTHATHVAGIMAGSYNGEGTYMNNSTKTEGNVPFYGVATGADLAFSCGELYDANVINGVQRIIDYAKEQGQPAVVNLSLGDNIGPHDGTDDMSQALARMGQDAIICIAAGNEGEDNISIQKDFTADDTTLKTSLYYNPQVGSHYGQLDIWCSDSNPVTVKVGTVSPAGRVSNATTLNRTSRGAYITKGFTGTTDVSYVAGVNSSNNRYFVSITFNEALPSTGRVAIVVEGTEGQHVDMYFGGYSVFTDKYNPTSGSSMSGFTPGTPDCSINGMGCGDNVITVGAFTTRNRAYSLGGGAMSTGMPLNATCSFSSYGRTFDGRQLPVISAPGSSIVSSMNRYYVTSSTAAMYGEGPSSMLANAANGTNTDYWGCSDGTSMSTPFVSGVVALWLQAKPTLTYEDVLDVMEHSSVTDRYTEQDPERFGYGKINAAAGLRYILGTSGVGNVGIDEQDRVLVDRQGSTVIVTAPGESSVTLTLTDLQGRTVASVSAPGQDASIDLDRHAAGVYVLTVTGEHTAYSTKLMK